MEDDGEESGALGIGAFGPEPLEYAENRNSHFSVCRFHAARRAREPCLLRRPIAGIKK